MPRWRPVSGWSLRCELETAHGQSPGGGTFSDQTSEARPHRLYRDQSGGDRMHTHINTKEPLMTRWNLVISDDTNRRVRSYLARTGGKKGDLSRLSLIHI